MGGSGNKPRMDTNVHQCSELLHGDLVFEIVGAAIEVQAELGPGLHEKPYENSMAVELRRRGKTLDQQRRHEITYKGVHVGEFIPDLIVDNSVVVDSKVIDRITNLERGHMLNYLRITQLRVGLIINFQRRKLGWERVIL